MNYFFISLATLAGAGIAIQASINSQLRIYAGHSIPAAFLSFLVGLFGLIIMMLIVGTTPNLEGIKSMPWWVWLGGLLGAFFIAVSAYTVRDLGPTFFFALVITGQLLATLAIDHYGWFGQANQPINALRLLGVALLVISVLLIRSE